MVDQQKLGRGAEAAEAALVEMRLRMTNDDAQTRMHIRMVEAMVRGVFEEMDRGTDVVSLVSILPAITAPAVVCAIDSLTPGNLQDRDAFVASVVELFKPAFSAALDEAFALSRDPRHTFEGDQILYRWRQS